MKYWIEYIFKRTTSLLIHCFDLSRDFQIYLIVFCTQVIQSKQKQYALLPSMVFKCCNLRLKLYF